MNVLNVVPLPAMVPPAEIDQPHLPVLLEPVLSWLGPRAGCRFVDATLGAGGHSEALLSVPNTTVIGIDRDDVALQLATERLSGFGDRFSARRGRFSQLRVVLDELGIDTVDGILADVGVSSMQLDTAERGLSFRREGPLDMRMDPTEGETALELIDRCDDDELADVIYKYGEERRSRRVARCIKQALAAGNLETTTDLRRAVVRAVGPARIGGVDPATRTFQALRIAVNEELVELEALLDIAASCLRPGGRLAVISFHSLEDRLVKRAFRDKMRWQALTKKPIVASDEESARNPRARSAKLRVAEPQLLSMADDEEYEAFE